MTKSVPQYGPMDTGKREKRSFRRSEIPYGMDALPLICEDGQDGLVGGALPNAPGVEARL